MVSSQKKLETLSKEESHNKHSSERPRTQPEYLSIDKYTFCHLPLISVYKTYAINNDSRYCKGSLCNARFLFNKSNYNKMLYLADNVLQSWAAL